MRTTIGIILLVAALIGSLTILHSAIVGDRAVKALIDTYGEKSPYEWYLHQPARELFHGELGDVSGILYFSRLCFIAYGAIGFLELFIGVQAKKPRSSACVIALTTILFAALVWPWTTNSRSIKIISHVVN
jgi:hypothetical protein